MVYITITITIPITINIWKYNYFIYYNYNNYYLLNKHVNISIFYILYHVLVLVNNQ